MKNYNVSIIIRTKNEERWISQCLNAVLSQTYRDFEIIIVDNESQDKTIEKAKQFKERLSDKNRLKVIECSDYLPGKALNMGIEKATGTFIACLSGHCIPANDKWLESLLEPFGTDQRGVIAGVYGRQQPMSFTSDSDKRDLTLVFGMDKRVQKKDSFFHNANSMIRRDVWKDVRFDDKVTNIEDRVWAKEVLDRKKEIVYTPDASVYHYHGIHQNGNSERCANVVRIMEGMHSDYSKKYIEIEKLNIVALIPIKDEIKYLNKKPLIEYTVKRALDSKYVKKVVVSTDNEKMASLAKKLGAEAPFIRDPYLSKEDVSISNVLEFSLKKMEEEKIFPDLIVSLEATFPFRPSGLIDGMIIELAKRGLDSIRAVKTENKAIWKEERDRNIKQLDEGVTPRKLKDPTFIELRGVGTVTHPEFLRNGSLFGQKNGIYEVNNPYSHIEVRDEEDFEMASVLMKEWFK
ncbi:MAG: glycosyltransferase family 2 protein [Candidatus Omnitrophica bacterium]|nr:glycosyltransferase family 2 protein [Candidatus Omnitrophota bacterium]